ncbi:MAG: Sua5 family C-terminal domain-containing protein, partial [Bacteroidota bacterium]|nr:Sua5 family C-terminal domain-containing protein [Bacteroidota bacterium]
SPVKPLYILDERVSHFPESSGLIVHEKKDFIHKESKIVYTSQTFNHLEIAANLFSALHAMEDDEHIKQIFIEPVPEVGLGIAIMDRIKKAAYKYQQNN